MSPRIGELLIDLSPLRGSRDFRWLYAGRVISLLSIGLIGIAVSMQVFSLTGSSLHVGMVSLCLAIPMTIGLVSGGVLADRFDRQRLMVMTRGAYIAVVITFLINAIVPRPQVWVIYVAAIVAGAINGLSAPPLMAALPSLVERTQVAAAGALITMANQLGAVIGPSVGGIVVGRWGFVACYSVVAVGALLTPITLARMRPLPPPPSAQRRVRQAFADAWRFATGNRLISALLLIDVAAALLASPAALFPQLGIERFGGGPSTVGLLYSAPAIGALIAGLASGWIGRAANPGRSLIACVMVWGAATALFGVMPQLAAALVLLGVAGMGRSTAEIVRRALLQNNTPPELQGRVGSLWLVQATVFPSLGNVIMGGLAKVVAPTTAVAAGGVTCVVATIWLAFARPELWGPRASIGAGEEAAGINPD